MEFRLPAARILVKSAGAPKLFRPMPSDLPDRGGREACNLAEVLYSAPTMPSRRVQVETCIAQSAQPKDSARIRAPAAPEMVAEAEAEVWTVYILRCGDDTFYTGITNAPERRLEQHSRGKASRYTRARLPVVFVYQEQLGSRSEALRREAAVKRLKRQEKSELIRAEAARTTRAKGRDTSGSQRKKIPIDSRRKIHEPNP